MLTSEECGMEAWKRVTKEFTHQVENDLYDSDGIARLYNLIGDCIVLYGNPNKPGPRGIMKGNEL